MKTILVIFLAVLGPSISYAAPPSAFIHIKKIEGTVIELPKAFGMGYSFVKIGVTATSSEEDTKNLYSTVRKKTSFPIKDLGRPERGQVILVVHTGELPNGTKVGDRIRVLGYGLIGSDDSARKSATEPFLEKIELNPKD